MQFIIIFLFTINKIMNRKEKMEKGGEKLRVEKGRMKENRNIEK